MLYVHAPKILKAAGIEPAGIEYWLERLHTPHKIEDEYNKGAQVDHPINWYNPKIQMILRPSPLSKPERAYFYLTLLSKLIPEPSEMSTWPKMRARLAAINTEIGFMREADWALPTNKKFLAVFNQRSQTSLKEWNLDYNLGHLWDYLVYCIQPLKTSGPGFWKLYRPYVVMLERLLKLMPDMDIRVPSDSGLSIFTSHCRFGHAHANQERLQLKDRLFVVRHHLTKDDKIRNIVPLVMLKTLKAGNVVHAAIDYGPGNFNLKTSVFGCEIALPDSSVWVARMSKCHCQWRFLVANHETYGTTPFIKDFELPDTSDKDAFTEAFLRNISQSIESAMVDFPFSFGPYRNVNL